MEGLTSTYDYSYSFGTKTPEDSCPTVELPYKDIILPALYATVFLVGTVGNALLIAALLFKRRVQRLIDIFIVNLAMSNFIFLITLPLWVDKEIYSGIWRSGSFLCKGSSYIISVNMHCSIFLLTCMSNDRYLAIMHPAVARRIRSKHYAIIVCICAWILSCLLGLPTLLSREDLKPPFCLPYKIAHLGMELGGPLAFVDSCTNPFICYYFDDYIRRAMNKCTLLYIKGNSLGTSLDTSDTLFTSFVHGEDASRRRRRSVSF
nr:G-protein coupled receptor 15 isoform X3 [Pogona vitticeps]